MIKVTLIRPSGCQHCGQVKGTLEKLKSDYPNLVIEEVEATTPEGQALIQKYGILSSPGILINDEFFAMGGATEKQLREKFEELKMTDVPKQATSAGQEGNVNAEPAVTEDALAAPQSVVAEGLSPDGSSELGDRRLNTRIFYGAIGLAASLALALVFYWSLRLNSSIASLVGNTYGVPLYFWPYVLLTFGTIVLFGVNAALFTYRWRKYGPPKLTRQGGAGLGSLVGVAASACPICGSFLLSAIGITAGLAAFPLQGLELKALSFGLMALPIWLTRRELKRFACGTTVCPVPRDAAFKDSDRRWLLLLVSVNVVLLALGWNMLKSDPAVARLVMVRSGRILNPNDNRLQDATAVTAPNSPLFDEVAKKVLPEQGFQSKIRLGGSVVRLVERGVIDQGKFEALYKDRELPIELKDALTRSSDAPIILTRENANTYVNFLWALGLANTMSTNKDSPIAGNQLFNFASTGGWNLGKEENGGAYFNKFPIVPLTPEQEALVTKIAQNSYRPCCNNSTFFQDCNHGSALLGLLQLGAAQGLSEDELWREALVFNSFWFPHNYLQTALYFKAVKNTDWENVDPKLALGKDYSSISGWSTTVAQEVTRRGLVPKTQGGAGCGV